ncbi:MAG: HAD-IA family hydrolase [Neomegalonema sp.]|nr:HAD-IA family hydrolase [Neomegalonema sp.]
MTIADDGPLKLAIFDFDGTLMDSQGHIIWGMREAFARVGRPAPGADAIRRVIGLGLVPAVQGVDPSIGEEEAERIGHIFVHVFDEKRATGGGEAEAPLFDDAHTTLSQLAETNLVLGIATGKGRRGLDLALDAHDLRRFFTVTQTANDAPGKPHPGMVENCLDAVGVDRRDAVVIGDTTYDMQMAKNAGVAAIGVDWGYHAAEELLAAGAQRVVARFEQIEGALVELWGARTW